MVDGLKNILKAIFFFLLIWFVLYAIMERPTQSGNVVGNILSAAYNAIATGSGAIPRFFSALFGS